MDKTLDLRKKNIKKPRSSDQGEILNIRKEDKTPEEQEKKPMNISKSMTWEFDSYVFNNRFVMILFLVIVFCGGAVSLVYSEILLGILLIISGFVVLIYNYKGSEKIKITIDMNGLYLANDFYSYKIMKSFWINYKPGEIKELSFELKKWYLPYIKIPLGGQNPLTVREFILNFLVEKEHEESITDIMARRF
jgi:hypothetical protein